MSSGYFATLRMPLVAGRDFNRLDTASSPRVAIVNETLARRFFPGGHALGERFRLGRDTESTEVVGIVRDAKYESVRQPIPATAFIPEPQLPADEAAEEFVLRTALPPASIIQAARRLATDVSRDTTVTASTLEDRIADDLAQERLIATLAGFFALTGLALAMVGLYGALSYLVTERQAEFGIRMAIGAPPRSVLRLVMKDVAMVLAVGLLGRGGRVAGHATARAAAVRAGPGRCGDDRAGCRSARSGGAACWIPAGASRDAYRPGRRAAIRMIPPGHLAQAVASATPGHGAADSTGRAPSGRIPSSRTFPRCRDHRASAAGNSGRRRSEAKLGS